MTLPNDHCEAPYDARVVANFILHYHHLRAEALTQLRLYKLLYFAHGWHLVERGRPLVWNSFEAWEMGPVIKVVRDNFAPYKEKSIDRFCSMFDFRKGEEVELPHRLREEEEKFVSGVIEAYRKYSAIELSLITHASGSSWDAIWKARTPIGRFGLRIRDDEILTDLQEVVDKWDPDTISTFA